MLLPTAVERCIIFQITIATPKILGILRLVNQHCTNEVRNSSIKYILKSVKRWKSYDMGTIGSLNHVTQSGIRSRSFTDFILNYSILSIKDKCLK